MNITSLILLLLLACSVASLTMRSHDLMVMINAPNIPPGKPLGELAYNNIKRQQVRTKVLSGGNTYIQDPAQFSTISFIADPSINAKNQVSSIPWLPNKRYIRITIYSNNGGDEVVLRGM